MQNGSHNRKKRTAKKASLSNTMKPHKSEAFRERYTGAGFSYVGDFNFDSQGGYARVPENQVDVSVTRSVHVPDEEPVQPSGNSNPWKRKPYLILDSANVAYEPYSGPRMLRPEMSGKKVRMGHRDRSNLSIKMLLVFAFLVVGAAVFGISKLWDGLQPEEAVGDDAPVVAPTDEEDVAMSDAERALLVDAGYDPDALEKTLDDFMVAFLNWKAPDVLSGKWQKGFQKLIDADEIPHTIGSNELKLRLSETYMDTMSEHSKLKSSAEEYLTSDWATELADDGKTLLPVCYVKVRVLRPALYEYPKNAPKPVENEYIDTYKVNFTKDGRVSCILRCDTSLSTADALRWGDDSDFEDTALVLDMDAILALANANNENENENENANENANENENENANENNENIENEEKAEEEKAAEEEEKAKEEEESKSKKKDTKEETPAESEKPAKKETPVTPEKPVQKDEPKPEPAPAPAPEPAKPTENTADSSGDSGKGTADKEDSSADSSKSEQSSQSDSKKEKGE